MQHEPASGQVDKARWREATVGSRFRFARVEQFLYAAAREKRLLQNGSERSVCCAVQQHGGKARLAQLVFEVLNIYRNIV